jgi:hypothetical protein
VGKLSKVNQNKAKKKMRGGKPTQKSQKYGPFCPILTNNVSEIEQFFVIFVLFCPTLARKKMAIVQFAGLLSGFGETVLKICPKISNFSTSENY